MSTSKGPVTEQTYDDWIQFTNHLSYFADDMGFIFRGHHNSDWKLETSLDRTLLRIKPAGIDLGSTYNFVLDMFAKNLRGRTSINKNIETNADELWSLGQHYGLATPLLDWSRSIFVALFFAFESHLPSPSGFRSIWAFHTGSEIRDRIGKYNESKSEEDQFRLIDPISDWNPRLVSQSGLFTKQPIFFNFIDWVKINLEDDAPYLIKLSIPDSHRLEILRYLRLMNIHHGTLFPNEDGAAKHCNMMLELLNSRLNI